MYESEGIKFFTQITKYLQYSPEQEVKNAMPNIFSFTHDWVIGIEITEQKEFGIGYEPTKGLKD